jgi:membrane protease YdiL (CAAX protease family)
VLLHLAPGAAGTLVYIAFAGRVTEAGYPPLAALLLAIATVIVPIELAVLGLAHARNRGQGEPLIAYGAHLPLVDWTKLIPALLIAAVVGSAIAMPADNVVAQTLFGWAPTWYLRPIDLAVVGSYSASAWMVTLVGYLVLNGVVGPVVEELYFRGWLLPRMNASGRWAPLLNTVLFSVYHFWTPWQFLSRVAAVLPFVCVVHARRNVYVGMLVHMLLNSLGGLLVTATVAGHLA